MCCQVTYMFVLVHVIYSSSSFDIAGYLPALASTPFWSDLLFCILSISCHRLSILVAHVNFHSTESSLECLFCCFFLPSVLLSCSCFLTALTSLLPFVASVSAFCALCTSTLLAEINTCSLVILLVFLTPFNSHYFCHHLLSSMPLMNCSFSLYLFLCIQTHFPWFWGCPFILWHSHLAPILVNNTVVIESSHCVEVKMFH